MEGGNAAQHSILQVTPHNDLSLITTSKDLQAPLEAFQATSAAAALAARLAARIKAINPDLSMLSVRALMVHAAHWTDAMERIENKDDRMSLCGYGTPDETRALFSSERCATYVFENELTPFKVDHGRNTYNHLHFYDMPWPKDLLTQMGTENVKMKITLSYYVEPSPGFAGRTDKNRYPSAKLSFDIKTATETQAQFLKRISKAEGEPTSRNDTNRWMIGKRKRERGTVQSDWIECTATEMADVGQIVVYPGKGWWKDRKLENVANAIPYTLIVSIETQETEIYTAVEAAIANAIGIPVVQGV